MQVMSEGVDKKHSEHGTGLRVDAALKAVAFPMRTIEAEKNPDWMSRIYNMLFTWSFQSSYIPASWLFSSW